MKYLLVLAAVLAVAAIWLAAGYNGFIKLRNMIDEAFSTMDVYLKKRYDLIPRLVETVKGYAAHESGTLEKVVLARDMALNSKKIEEKIENENMLSGTLKNLFAVAEAYPDLKANANFMDLQQQLGRTEDEIANSRKYYNAVVRDYNTKAESFPSNIIAGVFGFSLKPMFEVEFGGERQNVEVQF